MLIFLLAPAAFAVDTWEPYPLGPGAIEFYLTRSGLGRDGAEAKANSIVIGPAWGLHETTHLFLFTGIHHPDEGAGGLDFLSLGIFRNFYGGFERPLKLDAYFEMSAFGPGLAMSSMLAGLETNLDFEGLGLFARPSLSWVAEEGGDDQSEFALSLGLWQQLFERVQLLAELRFAESGEQLDLESTAIGLNALATEEVEIILEWRGHENKYGDPSFDITLGAVTVW